MQILQCHPPFPYVGPLIGSGIVLTGAFTVIAYLINVKALCLSLMSRDGLWLLHRGKQVCSIYGGLGRETA